MEIVNFTEARQNFKSVLDRVTDNVDCAIVVRRGGDDAVIMSKSHYDSIVNAARLRDSIAAVEAGETEEHDLIEEVDSEDLTSEACENRA
jgi:antitoxin YefM